MWVGFDLQLIVFHSRHHLSIIARIELLIPMSFKHQSGSDLSESSSEKAKIKLAEEETSSSCPMCRHESRWKRENLFGSEAICFSVYTQNQSE